MEIGLNVSKPKTLSQEQELAIAEAHDKIRRLEEVTDILSVATYRAQQRQVLRTLVRSVIRLYDDKS